MLVNPGKTTLLKTVLKRSEAELVLLGLVKKKGTYVLPIAEGVYGWVGLNRALRRDEGRVGINPVVGICHQAIERMIETLSGIKESRPTTTLSTSLGYLMPEKTYLEWLFEGPPFDCLSECKRMVKAIDIYGITFMRENASLEAILANLEQLRFTFTDAAAYRLPVAYMVAGKKESAAENVKRHLAELQTRSDVATQEYKTFGSNLLQLIEGK